MSLGFLQRHVTSHHPSVTAPLCRLQGHLCPAPCWPRAVCSLSSGPVVGGVQGPPRQHPPPPGPRPPHGLAARTQPALEEPAVSRGVRVGAQRGCSGSVCSAALEPHKGKPSRSGPPGKWSAPCVPCHLVVPHHVFQGPQHASRWAPDRCWSAGPKASCLPGSHSHWELNLHSSEGARPPTPSLVGLPGILDATAPTANTENAPCSQPANDHRHRTVL